MRRSLFWLLDCYPDAGPDVASRHATALEHARLADGWGYTGLWLAEHHFQGPGTAPNPAVLLAAISQCTARLRLGPAVSVLPFRDAIAVAEDYALVDGLSGGRLDMGVGSGSQPGEFEALGVDFESRSELFEQRLAALEACWQAARRGPAVSGSPNVAPVQPTGPRLFVASMHAARAREIGRAGHGLLTLVSPATADLAEVAARVAAHARGLEDVGAAGEGAEAIVVVFDAPALGRLIGALAGARPPDPGALYDAMRARDTGLFGAREAIEAQIERYTALGIEHLALATGFGGMEAGEALQSLRALAPSPSGLADRDAGDAAPVDGGPELARDAAAMEPVARAT